MFSIKNKKLLICVISSVLIGLIILITAIFTSNNNQIIYLGKSEFDKKLYFEYTVQEERTGGFGLSITLTSEEEFNNFTLFYDYDYTKNQNYYSPIFKGDKVRIRIDSTTLEYIDIHKIEVFIIVGIEEKIIVCSQIFNNLT